MIYKYQIVFYCRRIYLNLYDFRLVVENGSEERQPPYKTLYCAVAKCHRLATQTQNCCKLSYLQYYIDLFKQLIVYFIETLQYSAFLLCLNCVTSL